MRNKKITVVSHLNFYLSPVKSARRFSSLKNPAGTIVVTENQFATLSDKS